jgi:hypothetical protein
MDTYKTLKLDFVNHDELGTYAKTGKLSQHNTYSTPVQPM